MFHIKDMTTAPGEWDAFVQTQLYTIFVQSSLYGEFYKKMGEEYRIFGIYKEHQLVGGALMVSMHARRGNFLFVPYGPFLPEEGRGDALELLTHALKAYGKKGGYHFVRISPFIERTETMTTACVRLGFRPAPIHMLAEITWLLDLAQPEDAILSNMNKNHRNLIHRCEREGVRIVMDSPRESLADLHRMIDVTAKRHNFVRFSEEYINQEFETFADGGLATIVRGYLPNGQLDAAAIIIRHGTMACYRHSGSLNLNPKLPVSYLVQWEVIKDAQAKGMRWYNFWGIAPPHASPRHPFFGITHFKKGFGGTAMHLLPAMDLPLSLRYWGTWGIETARRIKRGF